MGGERSDPIAFKYPNVNKVHYLATQGEACYIIAGIRFFRISEGKVISAGFAIKNEKASLIEVDRMAQTLTYQVNDQNMLLNYKISGQKCTAIILKSSSKETIGTRGNRWI